MGTSSDLGQPFRPRQKRWDLGWEESKLCLYDITRIGFILFYLFHDALNTFYLRLYGDRYMVKDHSDSQQGFFYMHHPIDRITHTTAFVTPVMEHWLEQEIAQWVHHEGSIQQPIAP